MLFGLTKRASVYTQKRTVELSIPNKLASIYIGNDII